jgi:hypothetical protein
VRLPESQAPFRPADRRAELVRRGIRGSDIADAVPGANRPLVSRVLAGGSLTHAAARGVALYIAGAIGLPLEVVFPELAPKDEGDPSP